MSAHMSVSDSRSRSPWAWAVLTLALIVSVSEKRSLTLIWAVMSVSCTPLVVSLWWFFFFCILFNINKLFLYSLKIQHFLKMKNHLMNIHSNFFIGIFVKSLFSFLENLFESFLVNIFFNFVIFFINIVQLLYNLLNIFGQIWLNLPKYHL